MKKIVIAIDGHSSCGKSTTAKLVAKEMGYAYIDTGAMYRAVTLYFLQNYVDFTNPKKIQQALDHIHITFERNAKTQRNEAFLNGLNIEDEIRKMYISDKVSEVSVIPEVRHALVNQQQKMGKRRGVVMDGRDIGTAVFPDAEVKIFMTADVVTRAKRRQRELLAKNEMVALDIIVENLKKRDLIDSTRKESPLIQAPDAALLDTSHITIDEQVDFVLRKVAEKFCSQEFKVSGQIVDVIHKQIFSGTIAVTNGKITHITREPVASQQYIVPGFIDAHVHIESSMLVPSEFARLAVPHGTVATVSDPHEIANVLGIKGVEYMIENGRKVPFKFYFGAPSCVPATLFETAGAEVTPEDIEDLFLKPEVKYLAEMMNWPGVLHQDELVMQKITLAQKFGRPIDGHAPGLRGEQAQQYAAVGIGTDHECFTADEARDKLAAGMKILIREGSAAKNFEDLIELLHEFSSEIMFCSDDKHPNDLVEGHINQLVKRALARGIDVFDVLRAACVNPVLHYGLEVGLLRQNDPADFIILDSLTPDFKVLETFIAGNLVAENGVTLLAYSPSEAPNNFNILAKSPADFHFPVTGPGLLQVIEAYDGQLVTKRLTAPALLTTENNAIADVSNDILKIAVVNRYHNTALYVNQ